MRQRRRHGSVRVRDDIDREILDRCQSLQIGSCVHKFCRHSVCVCVCVCVRARLFNVNEEVPLQHHQQPPKLVFFFSLFFYRSFVPFLSFFLFFLSFFLSFVFVLFK